jgi:YVTN family beta-propeller protein
MFDRRSPRPAWTARSGSASPRALRLTAFASLVVSILGTTDLARAAGPSHTSPIQITDDGSAVWVANPDSDSVGKIDTASNTLLAEHPVGDHPRTVAIGGGSVYVANQGSQDLTAKPDPETVMRLDGSSGAVQATYTTPFGCAPYGVLYNPAGSSGPEVYVSCERTGEVLVLDAALGTLRSTVALDWPDPRGMALSSDGSRLYVAHFLTREPGSTAHVSEIDTLAIPPAVIRVLDIPADETTCETINSGKGVLNLLVGIHLIPSGAPGAVADQLWVGGVLQNNLTKGMFRNDRRFGGHADPMLCEGGPNQGRRCSDDADCKPGICNEGFTAVARNLYKVSFHDVTRFAISKIDLLTGQVVGKIDVDEANHGTDLVFNSDGTAAFVVDEFFNSLHIFNTARGQDGDPTTVFASPSRFGDGGVDPSGDCQGGSFLTASELPFILPPQVQFTPIAADPLLLDGSVALTGNDYDVLTGAMKPVADSVGTTPHGVAIHPDDSKIYVANFLSRNVTVVKTDGYFCANGDSCESRLDCGSCAPRVIAVVPSIDTPDPLPPQLLDGKILFHTAARDASVPNGIGLGSPAPRFNFDDPDELEPVGAVVSTSHDASYVACISCHPEGGLDGRSWDFSQFGASLRNTMDLRGRAGVAPGACTNPAGLSCTTDSQCANNGVGTCSNDPSVLCELDIQCGSCEAASPTPAMTCIADKQCGGVCSNDSNVTCTRDGDCGGFCREDGTTPCATDDDCAFGCAIANTCNFFACTTTSCDAAKCVAASPADVPRNVTDAATFLNPMVTVHWNGDRDQVEDFEFTYRSLMGAGDCDGVEDLPDKCIGALVMRSNVAKPQELSPDLGASNRGLSPRLDHMADYVYSLTSYVRNPNLGGGPSADAQAGADLFFSAVTRCAECHDGPSPANQHFTDKRPDPGYPSGVQGRPESPNPYIRHNVGTANAFDLVDPLEVADDIGQYQNAVLPIPGSRGELLDYVTPTLVDVFNTAPFNHDGKFATLLHGITPCNTQLDDCDHPDAGKNLNDQHGTTSGLTPRQLRLLEKFLLAPHDATPSGTVKLAAEIEQLTLAKVRFGSEAAPNDDVLDLKATLVIPSGSTFALGDLASEAIVLSLADVDEDYFEHTIPAGQVQVSSSGTRAKFRDRDGPIRSLSVRLRNPVTRQYDVKIKGAALDLALLDKNHITVALELGDEAFVRTRTFTQSNASRRIIRIVER